MTTSSPSIADAQRDMRFAYLGGAPGLLASALAWTVAGIVDLRSSPMHAVLALSIGGMFIHPAAVLLAKALGRPGAPASGNSLARLALEGTVILLLGLALAYGVSADPDRVVLPGDVAGNRWTLPDLLSLYGLRLYWACGTALALTGFGLVRFHAALPVGAFAGAAIETVFAVLVFVTVRRVDKA